jgi:hypothetical protein
MSYADNKKWRDRNRPAYEAGKKRYYAQFRDGATNSGKEWTTAELEAITAPDRPSDRELAKELGRSVQAIQVARGRASQ